MSDGKKSLRSCSNTSQALAEILVTVISAVIAEVIIRLIFG